MNVFHVATGAGVDDSRTPPRAQVDDSPHFFRSRSHLAHFKVEVGPIKPADDLLGTFDVELLENVRANRRGCGSGKSNDRRFTEVCDDPSQPQVIGTKVMPP